MPSLLRRKSTSNNASSNLSIDPPNQPRATSPGGTTRPANMSGLNFKHRRVRFDLTLKILDLNNVPLVSGTSFIKWHLPSSSSAEHRGKTERSLIKDHRVEYNYEKRTQVRLGVGKDGMLQECSVNFEILQEYSAGGRGERIRLGDLKLNLAEYVEASENPATPSSPGGGANATGEGNTEEGVVRRYLMRDSKINSTLKVSILMLHTSGPRDYYAPPLRTAPVFGGIAGIIHSSEPTAPSGNVLASDGGGEGIAVEDIANGPDFRSRNKEAGEMMDVYRRTLAAFWASQPGELKADEAIEDIFSGGDGWGKNGRPLPVDAENGNVGQVSGTNGASRDGNVTFSAGAGMDGNSGPNSRPGSGANTPSLDGHPSLNGRSSRGINAMASSGRRRDHKHRHRQKPKGSGEVDEEDLIDDLRSWRIGETAYG